MKEKGTKTINRKIQSERFNLWIRIQNSQNKQIYGNYHECCVVRDILVICWLWVTYF